MILSFFQVPASSMADSSPLIRSRKDDIARHPKRGPANWAKRESLFIFCCLYFASL